MGLAAAPALVAALLRTASLDVDLGVRLESRSSALSHSARGDVSRTSLSAAPRADVVVQGGPLLLETGYATRLWTSDLSQETSPLVSHQVQARLATYGQRTWTAQVLASGFSGTTDPLANPWRVVTSDARWQLGTTEPFRQEEGAVGARGDVALDPRTTVAAGATLQVSRASDPAFRGVMPTQRVGLADATLTRLVTERDTIGVQASGMRSVTDAPATRTEVRTARLVASWQRRLSPRTGAWVRAGASLVLPDAPGTGARRDVIPVGEVGLARSGEGSDASLDLALRSTTRVDRFSGDVISFADGVCTLRWALGPRLLLSVSASGGADVDGDTILAGGDARVAWAFRWHLALELGLSGRFQDDRRAGLPSVRAGAAVVALTWAIQPLSLGPAR